MMRKAVALLAGALIAAGLVVTGITAYKVIDPQAPAREQALQQQLATQWKAPAPKATAPTAGRVPTVTVRAGQPFALLRIPALGRDWKFAVVEGPRWPSCPPVRATSPGRSCPARSATSRSRRTTSPPGTRSCTSSRCARG